MQKKQAISSLHSRDMVDLKTLHSDWQRLVWFKITEKQSNRFTAFTLAKKNEKKEREK